MRTHLFLVLILLIGVIPSIAPATTPTVINYQGRLTTSSGTPVPDGLYSVVFTLYDAATGGSTIWAETQSVTTSSGLFAVLLGLSTPITDAVFSTTTRHLGIKVGADPEMIPRVALVSVPYAYRVATIHGAKGGTVSDSLTVTGTISITTGGVKFPDGTIQFTQAGASNGLPEGGGTMTGPIVSVGNPPITMGKGNFGASNSNEGANAFVAGEADTASGDYSGVASGYGNVATGASTDTSDTSTNLFTSDPYAEQSNSSCTGAGYAFIGGGQSNIAIGKNSFVGSGCLNSATKPYATVGGGTINNAVGPYSFIGGGAKNWARNTYSVAVGGYRNESCRLYSTVGGGFHNNAGSSTQYGGICATIGGGYVNVALGDSSTIAGGAVNQASGDGSAVGGGLRNVASGSYATVPGGTENNAAGVGSLAAGQRAQALYDGTFVWSDGTVPLFASSAANQFLIHASGGVGIGTYTPDPLTQLDVAGRVKMTGMQMPLTPGDPTGYVLTSDAAGVGTWQPAAASVSGWSLLGNTGTTPGTNFIGTTDNKALEIKVNNSRAFRIEPSPTNSPNLIGGYSDNAVMGSHGSFIGGGGNSGTSRNSIAGNFGVVGGGMGNEIIAGPYSTIAGGQQNKSNGSSSFVGGGQSNQANSNAASVVGGINNIASGQSSTVAGGTSNAASGDYSAIPGGTQNVALGTASFAAGQRAKANYNNSFVWNDGTSSEFASTKVNQFIIRASNGVGIGTPNPASGIALDVNGTVRMTGMQMPPTTGDPTGYVLTSDAVGVGTWKAAAVSVPGWSILGNAGTTPGTNFIGTIDNRALEIKVYNSRAFRIEPSPTTSPNLIGGNPLNAVSTTAFGAVIGGGGQGTTPNLIEADLSVIGGGSGNQVSEPGASYSTIAGGETNKVRGSHSAIGGGLQNTAYGHGATIPGGRGNTAIGSYSVAAGALAKAEHNGSIVLAASFPESGTGEFDATDSIASSGGEQLILRADSGIYLTNEAGDVPVFGNKFMNTSTGAYLSKAGSWTNSSDRNLKENFTQVDGRQLLEKLDQISIDRWNYRVDDRGVTHIGPTAQDFHAAFGVGNDTTSISTIDPSGVALAAIKELHKENTVLKAEVEELKALVQKLAAKHSSANGGM
jgi:trimeric autotransporter adhesin